MSDTDRLFSGSFGELYDRYLVPMDFAPFAVKMAKLVRGMSTGALLEVAAGTGIVTRELVRVLPATVSITATDLNEGMLTQARTHSGLDRVTWRQADAQALPFPDESFDCVLCQFGVMFFPDKALAFRETLRVLRPGGRYLFNVWDHLAGTVMHTSAEVVGRFIDRDPFTLTSPPYHDIPSVEGELIRAGFISARGVPQPGVTEVESARRAAVITCHGSVLRTHIDRNAPGRLNEITDAAAEAIAVRFGSGPICAPRNAILFTAVRPGPLL